MRSGCALCVAAALVSLAAVAEDLSQQRRKAMTGLERATTSATNAVLGKFNAEKASKALQKIDEGIAVFVTLYPGETPETGGASRPEVWTEREAFRAMADTLVARTADARIAAGQGQEAFTLAWGEVLAVCTACHDRFRRAF